MKGVVFTEFLEMVEQKFSLATVDHILGGADAAPGRGYTSVGTYPVEELVRLLVALSAEVKVPIPDLLFTFGRHLFTRFVVMYPDFFVGVSDPIVFLGRVDAYIHIEVRKLYADAELPRFESTQLSPKQIELVYHSTRRLADLAHGLIAGCGDHYGVALDVVREDLSGGRGEDVKFTVTMP